MRIGATFASSGGAVHNVISHIMHPNYNQGTFMNNDIGIVRVSGAMALGGAARAGSIPGVNFNIADNTLVMAVGWGLTAVSILVYLSSTSIFLDKVYFYKIRNT